MENFCKECRWFQERDGGDLCRHPVSIVPNPGYFIRGEEAEDSKTPCRTMRTDPRLCGIDGKLFEDNPHAYA